MISAGLISLSGYLPAKKLHNAQLTKFVRFLHDNTRLPKEYIAEVEQNGCLPGYVENNFDGWESKPWFTAWLNNLPSKKQSDPFQGAKERRRVPLDPSSIHNSIHPHPMLSSDAETLAGAMAIYNANINKDEIDLVLVSSLVPDRHVPLNASLVQYKLGLKNAGAYNIDTCCSSFITMLEIASTYVMLGIKKNVLIVASSIDSIICDKGTYYSAVTGDAAVAGIVSSVGQNYGYLSSYSSSDGGRHAAIIFKHRRPEISISTSQGPHYDQEFVTFNDENLCKEIAKNAEKDLAKVVDGALTKAKLTRSDIDFLVTHQPVAWAANAWRDALGVAENRAINTFEKYANIACCCVPVNLLEAIEQNLVKPGDRVVMASSGVGENHIALVQKLPNELIENIGNGN
jgi:3-oxoacyl-[acyl-carrier-protein] synthase-3